MTTTRPQPSQDSLNCMREVSHRKPSRKPRAPPVVTVRALIERASRKLKRARVFFGHGTDNPWDDAAALVWHALRLPQKASARVYKRTVKPDGQARVAVLVDRRIKERVPAVYLTGQTWFAGLPFTVDPRVLIPRS